MKNKINNKIRCITCEFNRAFDNTAVDSYAFDKVLHSEELNQILATHLNELTSPEFKEKITTFVIHGVEKIYMKTKREVKDSAVYYEYIDIMLSKISKVN